MIVLDTNVLSELLRAAPQVSVLQWVRAQPPASLFTTSVTRAEILYGIRLLGEGPRRDQLWEAALGIFQQDFAGRMLSFDGAAADEYADIAATRRAIGRPISQFDALIAAMTRSRGASLATRNGKDFDACGIVVIDPWSV